MLRSRQYVGPSILSLPSPYQSVFRIDDFSDSLETAFGQYSRRGVRFRERVCSDYANLSVAKSVVDQRCCCFCCVTLALMLGSHAISNLDHAIRPGRSLEAAFANDTPVDSMHQHKAVNPGIYRGGTVKESQPSCGKFGLFVRLHLLDLRTDVLARLRNQPQILCLNVRRAHCLRASGN